MGPLLDRGMKICSWDLGHMIKMATMPIHVKKNNKIFSETERPMTVKLGMPSFVTLILPSLFKCLPLVYFDIFYGMAKLGHLGFCMRKGQNCGFM